MTDQELHDLLVRELLNVAPEVDPAEVSADQDVRDALDIDSYDFMQFMVAVAEAVAIEIPEADYNRLVTLDGARAYLRERGV